MAKEDDSDNSEAEEEEDQVNELQTKTYIEDNDFVSQAAPVAEAAESSERRDQGFVRPKVLILTPFKQQAYQIIE